MKIQSLNAFPLNFNARISFIGSNKCVKSTIQCEKDSFEKIDFITPSISKQTFEKARNIVMQSLFDDEPKESIVLIKNNEILFFATGDEFGVDMPDEIMDDILDSGDGGVIILHSHTPEKTGLTSPLSIADIENLIADDRISSVCAVNNKGEFSIIEKRPYKHYGSILYEIMDERCYAGFADLFCGSKKKEYISFLKSLNEMSDMKINEEPEEFLDRMLTAEEKLDEYFDYAVTLKGFPKYMEDFWKNNAADFGFNYYSNFSF